MHLELLGAGESLATARLRALVRLLAGVGAHVDDQLTRLDEGLLAHGTLVRPFARMDAHVTMQFAGMLKGASTDLTLVGSLLGMDATMHLQILLDAEQFVTELALERTFARVRAIVTDLQGKEGRNFGLVILAPMLILHPCLLTSLAGTANVFWHTLH